MIMAAFIMCVSGATYSLGVEFKEGVEKRFSDREYLLISKAAEALEQVVNSSEFKQRVLDFSYNGKNEFYQNAGLSNLEIYNRIQRAQEIGTFQDDYMMTLNLYRYRAPFWSKVLAYHIEFESRIYLNSRYLKWASVPQLANTIMHEWLHQLGFYHDYRSTKYRPYSVPYAIGEIVEDILTNKGEIYEKNNF